MVMVMVVVAISVFVYADYRRWEWGDWLIKRKRERQRRQRWLQHCKRILLRSIALRKSIQYRRTLPLHYAPKYTENIQRSPKAEKMNRRRVFAFSLSICCTLVYVGIMRAHEHCVCVCVCVTVTVSRVSSTPAQYESTSAICLCAFYSKQCIAFERILCRFANNRFSVMFIISASIKGAKHMCFKDIAHIPPP